MITQNVIRRVFLLNCGSSLGTCFALDHNGRQYIVTAKHVVAALQYGSQVEIGHNRSWISGRARLVGHGENKIDVSVFSLKQPIARCANIPTSAIEGAHLTYAQDVYFLGFPFGLYSDAGQINNLFPLPLVKRATFSGAAIDNGVRTVLLDGINNSGFSGGPVIFKSLNDSDSPFHVAAILGGYRWSASPVYHNDKKTDLNVRENTGIIVSYGIQHALDIIDGNPIGVPL